jgi:hypothetical protein
MAGEQRTLERTREKSATPLLCLQGIIASVRRVRRIASRRIAAGTSWRLTSSRAKMTGNVKWIPGDAKEELYGLCAPTGNLTLYSG